ncbi:type II secretion system minor pseudopilin GspJ [Enterobacillus tribolii]|uniref:Type II secretion system protein J n=1 Tax=Enterobacillus tribolii TaxID=1487935 RepID=A0A370Q645_9GAMM|nr:type II secretion system minor pseudopilin GspJ [Enterobacillus tribolii]MBW7985039.1 type II secretion system protein GspJ [Enterobacillus tribolii]RDK83779.1 general secretion pathway protein J [Enterobacillus tribolii]
MPRHPEAQHGFTLLEVLLAITVFAMLSLMSWLVLSGVLRANEKSQQITHSFNQLQRAILLLTNDVDGFVPRQSRSQNAILSLDANSLMFTSRNWSDRLPTCCAPGIQTLRWYLKDGALFRAIHYYPDNTKESASALILEDIDSITFRYFLNEWRNINKQGKTAFTHSSPLPTGLEVTLTLKNKQTITRRFPLPGPWPTVLPADDTAAATLTNPEVKPQ